MSQAACQIILQDPDYSAALQMALTVAQDTENTTGIPKCGEFALQQVADAWAAAIAVTTATLSEYV